MTRLPTVGGDTDGWGTVLNDYLTRTSIRLALASSPSAGATTFDVAVATPGLRIGSKIAIDAFTTQCELRTITNVSSVTITVDTALKYAHAADDVLLIVEDSVWTQWYGLKGDGSDEWGPLQRLVREATLYGGLTIRGGPDTYQVQQPLAFSTGSKIDRLIVQSRTGFTPTDGAAGCMIPVGQKDSFVTADSSTNVFTAAVGRPSVPDIIVFNAPYGETLPGGIVPGRWYYTKTTPSGNTFTISETNGGAEFDVTSDGAAWAVWPVGALTRISWESLRVNLTVPDLGGIVMGPQQPSWARNLRIEMDSDATTLGNAVGCVIGGQLSYYDNVEINTSANCVGLHLEGTGIVISGFNCNGVNNNDTGIVVIGSRLTLRDLWTEQCGRAAVELSTSVKGLAIEGYWLQSSGSPTTAPVLLSSVDGSYTWNAVLRCAVTTQLILNDTARGISLSGATEMDSQGTFFGLIQSSGGVGPKLNYREHGFTSASSYTPPRLVEWIKADASGGNITVNLPTAVGWLGQTYTIKHSGSGNSVIIDPNSTQTVDGASTLTLAAKQAVTIVSDGANWHVMDTKLAGSPTTYTPTNVSTDRAYDANATTLDEVADVLGTLIGDLQARGIIA